MANQTKEPKTTTLTLEVSSGKCLIKGSNGKLLHECSTFEEVVDKLNILSLLLP